MGKFRPTIMAGLLFFWGALSPVFSQSYSAYEWAQGVDAPAVVSYLEDKGIPGILCLANAQVEINDFAKIESLPLSDLALHMDDSDPRWDPYLKALPRLFLWKNGFSEKSIAFIPSHFSASKIEGLLAESPYAGALAPIGPREGLGRLPDVFFLLSWLLYAAGTVFLFGRMRFPAILSAALWSLGVLLAPGSLFLSSITLHFLTIRFFNELRAHFRRLAEGTTTGVSRLRGLLLLAALALVSLIVLLLWQNPNWADLLILSLEVSLAGIGLWLYRGRQLTRIPTLEHRLFAPVQLSWGRPTGGSRLKRAGLAAMVFLIPLATLSFSPSADGPRQVPSEALTLEGLAERGLKERGPWPGAASWIAHRAFQESFPYGGLYQIPEAGSVIGLRTFSKQEGRILETIRPVIVFDEGWLKEKVDALSQRDPARILLSQGPSESLAAMPLLSLGAPDALRWLLLAATFFWGGFFGSPRRPAVRMPQNLPRLVDV